MDLDDPLDDRQADAGPNGDSRVQARHPLEDTN